MLLRRHAHHETATRTHSCGLTSPLARLCETELLSPEAETELFRRLKFLNLHARRLQAQADPDWPQPRAKACAGQCLAEAGSIRERLIQANLRLVVSIVKRYVSPQQSLDDLLSDGTVALIQAVDTFEPARGYRFSTFAHRCIMRCVYRALERRYLDRTRLSVNDDEGWEAAVEEVPSRRPAEREAEELGQQLTDLVKRLDRREQLIVRSRHALGAHRKVQSVQNLADRLGISKERVRQLEQRAVSKLQRMVAHGVRPCRPQPHPSSTEAHGMTA